MSSRDEQILKDLEVLCGRLGAGENQASVMAGQILKRARQLADERDCGESEALEYLINVIVSGRKGETFPNPFPSKCEPSDRD